MNYVVIRPYYAFSYYSFKAILKKIIIRQRIYKPYDCEKPLQGGVPY